MTSANAAYCQPTIAFDPANILARWSCLVMLALFVVLNAALFAVLDPGIRIANSADSATWYGPAKALISHGMFGSFADPATPSADRGPIYPLILAGMMRLAGDAYPELLAIVQCLMLIGVALLTANIAGAYRSGAAPLAFGLVLFNPNLVGAVQLVQSETTYLVALTGLLFFILRTIPRFALRDAIGTGVLTGLAALTRPEGAFLIMCVPLGLLLVASLVRSKVAVAARWRQVMLGTAACLAASAVTVSPWVIRNINVGIGPRINETQNSAYYAWGAVEQVMATQTGKSLWEVPKIVTAEREKQIGAFRRENPTASPREIANRDFMNAISTLGTLPLLAHIKTIVKAKAEYVLAGGTGIWIGLLRGTDNTPIAIMKRANSNAFWSGWLDALTKYSVLDIALTTITIGFVVIMRTAGAVGAIRLWFSARILLFVLLAGISYQAFIQPYYGPSRFRLPVEPAFVLLAALAWPVPAGKTRTRQSGQNA